MLAVHYPDWPVVATGAAADQPVAVLAAGRVVAATAAARNAGILPGLRRREAQARCPGMTLVPADPGRAARVFEPLVVAVESVIPGVEVRGPGECVVPVRGAARYFGGAQAAVGEVRRALAAAWPAAARMAGAGCEFGPGGGAEEGTGLPPPPCGVGVAEGPFAAAVAARGEVVVPPGGSAAFLAPLPVDLLGDGALVELLHRLGLVTLGSFAALPAADVAARFGPAGEWAHRLARGLDPRAAVPREQPRDLGVTTAFEPPADRVEQAAFAARRLAEQAHERLREHGLACTGIRIEAETEHGECHVRTWRHDGPLSAAAITDRVRWQLDGWLAGSAPSGDEAPARRSPAVPAGPPSELGPAGSGPSAGLLRLRVDPVGLLPAEGRQLGLWGEPGAAAARIARALTRVQGLLGPEAVLVVAVEGGRDPADRVRLVPWGEPRVSTGLDQPWPGALPAPAPALVHRPPLAARVLDAAGEPVGVSARCAVTAPPARLVISAGPPLAVTGWAGPWPVDERWWEAGARRRARFQISVEEGHAYLLAVAGGQWWVEASYD